MIIDSAQPFPFSYSSNSIALIIIDMQRDFIEPDGFGASLGNDVSPLQEIIPAVGSLLNHFRNHELLVIHTRECHQPDLSDCPPAKLTRGSPSLRIGDSGPMGRILIKGEPGADIIPQLSPLREELVLDKPGKGAFYKTELQSFLTDKNIKQLVIAGVTTEVCVQSTMREANDRGYDCLLAIDATASYFPEFKESTINMIRAQGAIVGWTASVQQIIDSLNH